MHAIGASEALIRLVKDRPGHDRRYALSSDKMAAELGWKPTVSLVEGIMRTVAWYRINEPWWRPLKDEQYRSYYQRQYGQSF